jgi:hypothetical protein
MNPGPYFGSTTVSTTWMTPFDWNTFACVTVDMPPFSSFSTTSLPCIMAQSVPPLTVFNSAVPLPALI